MSELKVDYSGIHNKRNENSPGRGDNNTGRGGICQGRGQGDRGRDGIGHKISSIISYTIHNNMDKGQIE